MDLHTAYPRLLDDIKGFPGSDGEPGETTPLNQVLIDALPCVALLLDHHRDILFSNKSAHDVGAVPGMKCYGTWGQRETPCPWCLAPKALKTMEPQHLEVEALGFVMDTYWVPINAHLYLHYAFDVTDQKRSKQRLEWELAVASALANLSSVLLTEASIVKISQVVLDHAKEITTSAHGFVSEIDPTTGDNVAHTLTEMVKHQCRVSEENRKTRFPKGPDGRYRGLGGHALNTGQAFYTNSPATHTESGGIPDGHLTITAFLTIPAFIGQELVGQIALANPERDYSDRDLEAIQQFSNLYALALQRERRNEEKKKLEEQFFESQKMESIGRLAGGIAHDFNNILMGIIGNAESLARRIGDRSAIERKAAERIVTGADRAAHLTKQLLSFARGGKYHPIPLNINHAIEETIHVSEKIFEKNISVVFDFEQDIDAVEADDNQLNQVLTNLAINAKEAMPKRGTLTISTRNVGADEELVQRYPEVRPARYVKVSFADTGKGMSLEVRERIFEPFFTTKEMGTGLGLATVYGIIKNHEGYIYCSSEPKEGTTFTFYLPASEKAVAEKKAGGAVVTGEAVILVVDDEVDVRSAFQQQLESLGYTVLLAADGIEALDVYEKRGAAIDLVLLDLIMPDMAGRETYQALKKLNPDVKVFLVSGYSNNDKAAATMIDEGALGFIQKPLKRRQLSKAVSQALQR